MSSPPYIAVCCTGVVETNHTRLQWTDSSVRDLASHIRSNGSPVVCGHLAAYPQTDTPIRPERMGRPEP
eukprot:2504294-Prorocentrum_lima.AAC.1